MTFEEFKVELMIRGFAPIDKVSLTHLWGKDKCRVGITLRGTILLSDALRNGVAQDDSQPYEYALNMISNYDRRQHATTRVQCPDDDTGL